MSSTPFGDHLKREREMRGVSLEEIAAATRISTRFLEALEKEQWSELPGGVFNRGFIRSVSKYLGLDEEDMVAEYALETQQGAPPTAGQRPLPNFPNRAKASADMSSDWRRRSWIPAAVGLSALAVLVAAGWFVGARFGPTLLERLHRLRVASADGSARSASVTAPGPTSAAGAAHSPITGSAPTIGDPAVLPPVGANPLGAATDSLELKIEAGKPAHVRVTADGQSVFDADVGAGGTKTFQARDSFEVTSNEASALVLEHDGHPMPPNGSPGQPGSVTLSRKDLQPPGGGSH
jgi:cytoskeleton protein RodZ